MGQCNVSLDMLRKARDVCIDKSFSDCKYADMAPLFGLKPRGKGFDIPSFPPSKCRIPLSVWQAILDGMDQLENEIGSFDAHENVQAKSQWTAAWFRPLVAMFESRILNRPEKTIVGNRTRGGRVELQYCLQGQCLLVVIVVKTLGDSMAALDAMAQLIAELDAADFCNRKAALAIPVVKGILTDGRYFRFVNFEDGKITRSPHIATQFSDHETTATSIKPICEMFFACLLEGWVHGLRAFHARSQRRETMEGVRRPSATDWDSACVAATNALKVASNLKPADKAQQALKAVEPLPWSPVAAK
ncbi:hypothetical protein HKX48_007255 [Thoreauomyces humboldtii]|nr:hypothetical protein HKX48_007255 [Thoreauomyces humboldtii]